MATRVSYQLNLRGPSCTVQTACSTSLLAIHMACQSLLNEGEMLKLRFITTQRFKRAWASRLNFTPEPGSYTHPDKTEVR